LHQAVILHKKERYMNIYEHISYISTYVFIYIYIYSYMKNFLPGSYITQFTDARNCNKNCRKYFKINKITAVIIY